MATDAPAAENGAAPATSILPDESDHAVLQQPLNLGVKNVKQILKCIQGGSPEVRDLILNECNIIYECKVCLSLFRSLANFLYHKRAYCKNHLCEDMLLFEHVDESEAVATVCPSLSAKTKFESGDALTDHDETKESIASVILMTTDSPNSVTSETDSAKNGLAVLGKPLLVEVCANSSVEKYSTDSVQNEVSKNTDSLQKARVLRSATCLEKSKDTNTRKGQNTKETFGTQNQSYDVLNVESINGKNTNAESTKVQNEKKAEVIHITLKPMSENSNAVFQSAEKALGADFAEDSAVVVAAGNHNFNDPNKPENDLERDESITFMCNSRLVSKDKNSDKFIRSSVSLPKDIHLSRRKRLLNRSDCNVAKLMCCNCQTQFTTLKTLYFHMISFHSQTRMYFPCPFCKTLFVQMYGVTRHLMQVHGKRKDQINNKLRETIRKKAVWKRSNIDDSKKKKIDNQISVPVSVNCSTSGTCKPSSDDRMFHSYVKVEKRLLIHCCSKCNRVFSRKSSQVSHEKFCIMNSRLEQSEIGAASTPLPQSLSGELKKMNESETKMSTRPKRAAEKQMHKDFVNSQTLKWRSANKIETNNQSPTVNAKRSKIHERKIISIVNVAKLMCLKCNKKFSSFSNLRRHAAIHIGWTRYKCVFCNAYQSYNRSECRHHVERAHSVAEENLDRYVVSLLSDVPSEKTSQENSFKQIKDKGLKNADKDDLPKKKRKQPTKNITHVQKKIFATQRHRNRLEDQKLGSNEKKSFSDRRKTSPQECKKPAESKKWSEDKKSVHENRKSTAMDTKKMFSNPKKDKNIKNDPEVKQMVSCTKPSYKSVTTSSPTTIILSKTCSSSSVQIVKNHTSVTYHDSLDKKNDCQSNSSVQKDKSLENSTRSCGSSASHASSQPIVQIIPCKYVKNSLGNTVGTKTDLLANPDREVKKNRTISDWLTKQSPASLPRRDAAPLIIGLVPASNSNAALPKPPSISTL